MLRFLRGATKRTKTVWWVLIFVTVVTFLGGFVFLLGAGFDTTNRARAGGALGVVNGIPISRTDYQNALNDQRENYRRSYGMEPTDRDLAMVEVQAWRTLLMQRLMTQQAHLAGLKATDPEVVLGLKTSPPPILTTLPTFQTDGKFDVSKYQAALRDPNINWAPFEQMMREQLPMRKYQERLLASVKLSEPELEQALHDRFDRVNATVAVIPPTTEGTVPNPTDADLQRVFDKHKSRFTSGPRTRLEVLLVPKKFNEPEIQTARQAAQQLANRARAGEDFAALARDNSEGPGAERGGVIDRVFRAGDLGPELGPIISAMPIGTTSDAYRDAGRFIVFHRLPPDSVTPPDGIRLAQIVVKVRPDDAQLREQYQELVKIRSQATRGGLSRAATSHGMATSNTGPFDMNTPPQILFGVPQAPEWGLTAKKGEVSPLFEGIDEFAICQVSDQSPAGVARRDEVAPQLRQLAELDARVQMSKPKADAIAQALAQGQTLEQAAAAGGITASPLTGVTRLEPDPRVAGAPELVGALFGARPGQVIGPIRAINGWYFARVDQVTPADAATMEGARPQVTNDLLDRRQRSLMTGIMTEVRYRAKVKDLRSEIDNSPLGAVAAP